MKKYMCMGIVFETILSYLPNAFLPPLTLLYLVAQIRSGWWQGMLNIWPSTNIRLSIIGAFCPSMSLCYFFGGSNPRDGQVCRLFSILATNLVTSDFGAGNAELVVRCAIFIEKKNFGL